MCGSTDIGARTGACGDHFPARLWAVDATRADTVGCRCRSRHDDGTGVAEQRALT